METNFITKNTGIGSIDGIDKEYLAFIEPHNNLAGFLQRKLEKEVNKEAMIESHLYSDETELNHLPFTEVPPLPSYEKPKVAPLSAGVYNLVRQFLP